MSPVPRPGILEAKPYVGGEAGVPGFDRPVRLASNENPLGASPRAGLRIADCEFIGLPRPKSEIRKPKFEIPLLRVES